MRKKKLLRIMLPLLLAAAITLAAWGGLLRDPDTRLSDAIVNRPKATDDLITVIGIDRRALDELGPWPWSRDIMAQIINLLNKDPDNKPAVIGIDVLYAGYTKTSLDKLLAEACEKGGNVVTAEAATFKSDLYMENGVPKYNRFAVDSYDEAFPELRAASHPGHINAMPDTDGVIRHGLLYVDSPKHGRVYSFAAQIYTDYCAAKGLTPSFPETDANGFFTIPYSVKPGGFSDNVSVADILYGIADRSRYAGKIVLIGPYTAGLQDQYITSVSRGEPMYGVEIQANIITALLEGQFPREAADPWQLALLFFLTFGAALFFTGRKLWVSLPCWLVLSGGWLALSFFLPRAGWILHPLWIPAGVTLSFIVSVALSYIRASLEKKKVADTFSRYVDPAIVGELMKEGTDALDLGGKLMDVAVLFVDIRGFTTMSEVLEPREIVSILNRYLALTTDCVMRYHGTLDKYVGDCTMAIWNAPLPREDHIMLACRAALDMVRGSEEVNRELQQTYGRSVSFGIGVHCGPAIIGNIGTSMRMDFTAIGDTVNTAARLEANAPGGTVYISRDVAEALKGRIACTPLPAPLRLKGKAEGFEVFTLEDIL